VNVGRLTNVTLHTSSTAVNTDTDKRFGWKRCDYIRLQRLLGKLNIPQTCIWSDRR